MPMLIHRGVWIWRGELLGKSQGEFETGSYRAGRETSDLTLDLTPEFNRLNIIVLTLAAGQIVLQVLFYLVFGMVSRCFIART